MIVHQTSSGYVAREAFKDRHVLRVYRHGVTAATRIATIDLRDQDEAIMRAIAALEKIAPTDSRSAQKKGT